MAEAEADAPGMISGVSHSLRIFMDTELLQEKVPSHGRPRESSRGGDVQRVPSISATIVHGEFFDVTVRDGVMVKCY